MSNNAKIVHELGKGETYLVTPEGERKRIPCFDIKVVADHSEIQISFWPKKKSDRKKVMEHFEETGEILSELNQ